MVPVSLWESAHLCCQGTGSSEELLEPAGPQNGRGSTLREPGRDKYGQVDFEQAGIILHHTSTKQLWLYLVPTFAHPRMVTLDQNCVGHAPGTCLEKDVCFHFKKHACWKHLETTWPKPPGRWPIRLRSIDESRIQTFQRILVAK